MNPATIYHRPLSEFAFATDGTHYVFRLRTGKGEARSCRFFYADRAAMAPELDFACLPMKKSGKTGILTGTRFGWKQSLSVSPTILNCRTGRRRSAILATATKWPGRPPGRIISSFPSTIALTGFPSRNGRRTPLSTTFSRTASPTDSGRFPAAPMGNRFGRHHPGRYGESGLYRVHGVQLHLSEPDFVAESYHRYDTLDYYQVDPHMGSKEDVRALVEKAHSLGIRVLLDGVFNHISSRHFLFQDVLRNGMESKYYSCFYQLPAKPKLPAPGELPEYTCFSYVASMPKTNTADPYLRQYFCDVGVYWIREFDIDGWRLDVANELDDGFLRAFRTAVKAAKPDAIIVGEVWENAAHYLNGDMMDSAMNYDFRRYCRRFFAEETVDAETFDTNVSTLCCAIGKTPCLPS